MSLGNLIDSLYETRTERLQLQKEIDRLAGEEKQLQLRIHSMLQEAGLERASGHRANFSYKTEVQPLVEDWEQYFSFVADTKAFVLVQKRVGVTAWKEYRDNGLIVPGSRELELPVYSLTKR